jgi:hypothetical protein
MPSLTPRVFLHGPGTFASLTWTLTRFRRLWALLLARLAQLADEAPKRALNIGQ